jgi:DNA-directed RNA polymerase subunit L/DNA-directed RNA polymerase alpha subunit
MADDPVFHSFERVDDTTIRFTMSPTEVTYANCLRRSVQTEVVTLGFRSDMTDTGTTTDVKVIKNTTPMSNEMLADRIGLIPIHIPEGVNPETWEREKVLFRLHVVNKEEQVGQVTADMFECYELRPDDPDAVANGGRVRIENTKFFTKNPVTGDTCLIAMLKPFMEGQAPEEIELEAYATSGKGREHTRFNPSCVCAYKYTPDTNEDKLTTLWEQWLEQKKINRKELDTQPEKKDALRREFNTLERFRSYLTDSRGEPYSFDFTIESIGTLSAEDMVYKALIELSNLASKYSTLDVNDLPPNVELRPADANMRGYDIWIQNEDHTFGSMIQTWILENDTTVDFAGYKIPHPLRAEMVLRLGVEDTKTFDEESARSVLASAAKGCADMYLRMSVEWATFVRSSGKIIQGAPTLAPVTPWKAHASMKEKQRAAK